MEFKLVLVPMISPEERNKKPYAPPVQCLAYVSLGDMAVRRICDVFIKKVASMCNIIYYYSSLSIYKTISTRFATNGEWNSHRSKGCERPLSIFEIKASVHQSTEL